MQTQTLTQRIFHNKWQLIFCVITLAFCGVLVNSRPAAATTKDSILEKAVYTDIYKCYTEKGGTIKKEVPLTSYAGTAKDLIGDTHYNPVLPNTFKRPNGSDIKDYNCQKSLTDGYTLAKKKGQKSPSSIPPGKSDNDGKDIKTFMTGMGYNATGSSKSCITFNYKVVANTSSVKKPTASNTFCATVKDGVITSKVTVSQDGYAEEGKEIREKAIRSNIFNKEASKNKRRIVIGGLIGATEVHYEKDKTKWDTLKNNLITEISKNASAFSISLGGGGPNTEKKIINFKLDPNTINDSAGQQNYVIINREKAGDAAVKYLSNETLDNSKLKFNDQEKAVLLQTYLQDFYNIKNEGCDIKDNNKVQSLKSQGYKEARLYDKDKFKMCWVKPRDHDKNKESDKVYIWGSSGRWGKTKASFDDVLKLLNGLKVDKLDDGADAFKTSADIKDEEGDGEDQSTAICWANAGALGWIICPVLETLNNAATQLYEQIADNFLVIDAGLLAQGGNSNGAYTGWKEFQTYANIIFAVLLSFVILAQLTGLGFSNYNIKKSLPKLIIAVVLINLSFILCQIAVDISNIVGSSLYDLFMGLGKNVNIKTEGGGSLDGPLFSALSNDLVNGIIGTAEAGITIGIIGTILVSNVAWSSWVPLLAIGLVSCVIAVVFLFVLLAARKAGVVILVVLAPAAVICYALPNTKKIFDRWFKMFSSLLLVYPICSALVGGGDYMSKILLNTAQGDNAGMTFVFTAMLVAVIPFFLTPMVLKSSFSAIGAVGNRLASWGDRFGRGVGGAVRRSQFFKNRQEGLDRRQAAHIQNKYNGDLSGIKSGNKRRRLARIVAANNRLQEEDIKARSADYIGEGDRNYRLMEAGFSADKMDRDVDNESALISQGLDENIGAKYADANELGLALSKELKTLSTDSTNYRAQVRARALINNLTGMGENGEKAVRDALHTANRTGIVNNAGARNLMSYTIGKHGATYKKDDKGTFKLMQDIQEGKEDYSNTYQEVKDENGNGTGEYYSQRYASAALEDISGKAFGEANDSMHQYARGYLQNAAEGDGKAQELSDSYLRQAETMYSSPNVMGGVKAGTEAEIQSTLMASANAQSMANMSSKLLEGTARYLSRGGTDTGEVERVANIAQASLKNTSISHTDANYNALRDILEVANNRLGSTRYTIPAARTGNGGGRNSEPAPLNVDHSRTIDLDTSNSNFENARREANQRNQRR